MERGGRGFVRLVAFGDFGFEAPGMIRFIRGYQHRTYETYKRFKRTEELTTEDLASPDVEIALIRRGIDATGLTIGEIVVDRFLSLAHGRKQIDLVNDKNWLACAQMFAVDVNRRCAAQGVDPKPNVGTDINWWAFLEMDLWRLDYDSDFGRYVEGLLQPLDEDEERSRFWEVFVKAERWKHPEAM